MTEALLFTLATICWYIGMKALVKGKAPTVTINIYKIVLAVNASAALVSWWVLAG